MTSSENFTEQQRNLSLELAANFEASSFYSSNWLKEGADLGFDSDARNAIERYLAEKNWLMIDWQLILSENAELWHIVSVLTPLGYRQLFPSFLGHCIYHQRTSLLCNLFIESHLNITNVYDQEEMEFYSSLSENQAICVAKVLEHAKCHGNSLAVEALDSYWGVFL